MPARIRVYVVVRHGFILSATEASDDNYEQILKI